MLIGGILVFAALFAAAMSIGAEGLNWLWIAPVSFVGGVLALAVLAFLFLWIACQFVDQSKEQEHDSKFYRNMLMLYISAIKTVTRLHIHTQGLEKTPKDGRFMLVCNHISLADPVVLLHCFSKSQLAFISKRENASMFVVGKVMHKMLCQTINRENDREALKTIINCIRLIQEDQVSVGVFPEGRITGDDLLHPFRSGVFKIAQKTKVPIVVCTLQNTQNVFRNAKKLKPTDVQLHLVDVVQPEEFESLTTVDIANRIHAMMAEDLGPELVWQETT
jgi:1-acyl-sn-glycerol-3-phosphate acyltransferase